MCYLCICVSRCIYILRVWLKENGKELRLKFWEKDLMEDTDVLNTGLQNVAWGK